MSQPDMYPDKIFRKLFNQSIMETRSCQVMLFPVMVSIYKPGVS